MRRSASALRRRFAALALLVGAASASCSVDERVLHRKTNASTASSPNDGGEAGETGSNVGQGGRSGSTSGSDAGAPSAHDGGEGGGLGDAGSPSGGSAGSGGSGGASQSGSGGTPSTGGTGGTGGEPFVGPCGDLNGNLTDDCEETLVQNSRFDTDATGWLVDPKVQQAWNTTNATGASGSGSVALINTNVVAGLSGTTTAGSRQCLAGFGKEVFELAARVFLKEGQGEGRAAISVATYGHDNCQGTFLQTFTVGPAVTVGAWQVIRGEVKMPAAARSFWVRLVVTKPLAEPSFEALVDDVLVAKQE